MNLVKATVTRGNGKEEAPEQTAVDKLSDKQFQFVMLYVYGTPEGLPKEEVTKWKELLDVKWDPDDDIRGIAYKCYCAAGYVCKNNNVAMVSSSYLRQNVKVVAAIKELRDEIVREANDRLRPWRVLAVPAQKKIEDAIVLGKPLTGTMLAACDLVFDRAFGVPAKTLIHEGSVNIDMALKALAQEDEDDESARRLTAGEGRRLPGGLEEVPE